jgi:hypothetical protein
MKRRLFNIASALSLLLCLAAVVMWIRSYSVLEYWDYRAVIDRESGVFRAGCSQHFPGFISLSWDRVQITNHGAFERSTAKWFSHQVQGQPTVPSLWRQISSFSMKRHEVATDPMNGSSSLCATVPFWFLTLLLIILPVRAFLIPAARRWRRHCRRRMGLCIHCGYNLTGNVSGVCPECGVKI